MTTFIMRQVIRYFRKPSLPHVNGSHLPHLFLISTTTNSKKSETNDYYGLAHNRGGDAFLFWRKNDPPPAGFHMSHHPPAKLL